MNNKFRTKNVDWKKTFVQSHRFFRSVTNEWVNAEHWVFMFLLIYRPAEGSRRGHVDDDDDVYGICRFFSFSALYTL